MRICGWVVAVCRATSPMEEKQKAQSDTVMYGTGLLWKRRDGEVVHVPVDEVTVFTRQAPQGERKPWGK